MDATMATAVEGVVQPLGETAATSKVRPGCVLAAAGLAVAAGVSWCGWNRGLGAVRSAAATSRSELGVVWGSSGAEMTRGWTGSPLGGRRCLDQPGR